MKVIVFILCFLSLSSWADGDGCNIKLKDISGKDIHPNGQRTKDIVGNLVYPSGEKVFDILKRVNPPVSTQFSIQLKYSNGELDHIKYKYVSGSIVLVYTVGLNGVINLKSCQSLHWNKGF
jgi:hypothetical protein